ncbi:MAG TPA: prepilin-type N-terminal cleavage/methylation domain-containing protein [Burkholderiaceae bacterium]|nr:prepilin-type N-terminal cleavage/methylation domain-containing protein [Burkholderiaceae bacterium]
MRRAAGFTLVEVLVALLIMAILSTMAWQGVDGMVRARDASQAAAERTLRMTTVMAQWEQDLASLYDSSNVPAIAFDGASLRLARSTPDGAQIVVWSLREGVWRRWASPSVRRAFELQQAWLMSQQLIGTEDQQVRLFEGATQWQLYFFRGNAWSNAQSSAGVAPAPVPPSPGQPPGQAPGAAPRAPLPNGVRLVLSFGDERRLTRDVALGPSS